MQNINNMEIYDLHCHSTASDGTLTPAEVVYRAHSQGVRHLALTDHDTVKGLAEAQQTARKLGIHLIPGIELSATWERKCLHIIGLGISAQHPQLLAGLGRQQDIRCKRAEKIAAKLAKQGIFGALDMIKSVAMGNMVTRSHFANFLVTHNHVNDLQEAFDKYLGQGKSAYVATAWAELNDVVSWINECGGIAVLAHPLRYKLTNRWLNRLLEEFKQVGGQGIEVVTGRSNVDDIQRTHFFAQKYQLYASSGSDFHCPDQWVELGRLAELPAGSKPVWDLFR